MIMTEKSKQHVDSCRFCWMCRHICPVGNATGQERNNARARALALSLLNRGALALEEVIDNMYECATCGACTKECVTGWDPVMFIKETRLNAALEGKTPDYINTLIDNCLDTGNAYGVTKLDGALAAAIAAHNAKTGTLLFLGSDTRYAAPECGVNAIRLLEKAGISFTVLADEPASGEQLDFLIGAAEEAKSQMAACAAAVGGFDTVVIFDPADAKVMKRTWQEYGIECSPKLVTFTAFLANAGLKLRSTGRTVCYQDPFQLARDLQETEEARGLISSCAALQEMLLNRKDTMWAGNILMAQYAPITIEKVSCERIANAKNVGCDTIVTASVGEYTALRKVAGEDFRVISLEELLLEAAE